MHSEHFSEKELSCHCPLIHLGGAKVTQPLLNALERFRDIVGQPVLINDAYRCPSHNKEVGGVPNSQHVLGNAADIRVKGFTAQELFEIAIQVPLIHGFGRDDFKSYLHIDVRPLPYVMWCYDKQGKQIKWYDYKNLGKLS